MLLGTRCAAPHSRDPVDLHRGTERVESAFMHLPGDLVDLLCSGAEPAFMGVPVCLGSLYVEGEAPAVLRSGCGLLGVSGNPEEV